MKGYWLIFMIILLAVTVQSTELVFDRNENIVVTINLINSSGLWNQTGGNILPSDATTTLRIPSLPNCNTFDSDGDGIFSCGIDAGGADASAFNTANNATNYTTNYPNMDLNILDDWNLANNATNNTLHLIDNVTIIGYIDNTNASMKIYVDAQVGVDLSAWNLENNATNQTLVKGDNATLAQWNISSELGILMPKDSTLLVRIGYLNDSLTNLTLDKFSVVGSSAFYGSLNSTFFNATKIFQRKNQVQTINAVYNSVNFTTNYDVRGDRFLYGNITSFFGDSGFNGSVLRIGNLSNIFESAFNVANNATNYTINYPNMDLDSTDDFNVANNATNWTTNYPNIDLDTTDDFNYGNFSNNNITLTDNTRLQFNSSSYFGMNASGCITIRTNNTGFAVCLDRIEAWT